MIAIIHIIMIVDIVCMKSTVSSSFKFLCHYVINIEKDAPLCTRSKLSSKLDMDLAEIIRPNTGRLASIIQFRKCCGICDLSGFNIVSSW